MSKKQSGLALVTSDYIDDTGDWFGMFTPEQTLAISRKDKMKDLLLWWFFPRRVSSVIKILIGLFINPVGIP